MTTHIWARKKRNEETVVLEFVGDGHHNTQLEVGFVEAGNMALEIVNILQRHGYIVEGFKP